MGRTFSNDDGESHIDEIVRINDSLHVRQYDCLLWMVEIAHEEKRENVEDTAMHTSEFFAETTDD